MSDRTIEKSFLWLVFLSLIFHLAAFAVLSRITPEKPELREEPVMVELEDLPPTPVQRPRTDDKARRQAEEPRRVERETAPRGEMPTDRRALRPAPTPPRQSPAAEPQIPVQQPPVRGEGIVRPSQERQEVLPDMARLLPRADRLAKLEAGYRKKYGGEVEEGETRFLNTDDIQFGSFLRRFETAVYGVWRYPPEAARQGIEGVTPVKITFNRKGEVERVEVLESSGHKILDDEVLRTLRQIGPVGGFPKGYTRETFNLIAFFQYGVIRGINRGVLH